MIKTHCIAYGVRVKLTDAFQEKCIGDKFLKDEAVLFVSGERVMSDEKGEYVYLKGGSLQTSGYAYLTELELEYPVPNSPLYAL